MKRFGKCGKYYRANFDYNFNDGLSNDYGYILKSDVKIPTQKISLEKQDVILKVDESEKVNVGIKPSIGTEGAITWSSSNSNVAAVTNGMINGAGKGLAVITATTADGKKDSLKASIYDPVANVKGYMREKAKLLKGAYDEANVICEVNKDTNLTIIGDAGNYYYVNIGTVGTGFVNKKSIEIPITSIEFKEKNIVMKEGRNKKINIIVRPSIHTQNDIKWESKDKKIATIDKNGIVYSLKPGRTSILAKSNPRNETQLSLQVASLRTTSWYKIKDIVDEKTTKDKNNRKKLPADKMQAMTGYKNKMFFFKIKKEREGENAKTKFAALYTAKLKSNGKLSKIKRLKKYVGKDVGHANGMVAVYNKKANAVMLYIAPTKEKPGLISKIKVKNGKASSAKDLKCSGKGSNGKSFGAISSWKYKKSLYFILKSGSCNYVCKEIGGKMVVKYKFKTPDAYAPNRKNKTRGQGTVCTNGNGRYYVVNSFAYGGDFADKKYGRISYAFVYDLKIKSGKVITTVAKSHKLIAKKQVRAKKQKKNLRRFEMEDLYIYNGKIYLNSEGGSNCLDLIGYFVKK